MSINGLRFNQERHSSAPLETKSGSYIYAGDAANFHDWQFRTLLRIRLYEQQLEETSKSADPVGTTATEPAAEDADEYATFPDLSGATQAAQPTSAVSTPKSGASRKSSKSGKQKTDVDRGPLVNKVIEGLRGDAFSIARDLGLEVLSEPGGLVKLVGEIRSHVFPRAREEAKELFRAGQKQGGPLSRQPGEPMLSYVQRRRRWWHMLCELDDTMVFSDSLRTELMLELSGLNRQEILVVKACADTKDFEGVGKVLIENYSGTHLREGSRSWTGRGVVILNSMASRQAKVMAKANLLRRDRIPKQPMQPTPMMGRNMQNLGMKLWINPGRMIHMLACLVTLRKRSQET